MTYECGINTRPAFAVLRGLRPLIATSRFGVVTRADDVREVLSDYEHFTVPFYDAKMTEILKTEALGRAGAGEDRDLVERVLSGERFQQ